MRRAFGSDPGRVRNRRRPVADRVHSSLGPTLRLLFYSIGTGGAVESTAMYAWTGWDGVCVVGAMISGTALGYWARRSRVGPDYTSGAAATIAGSKTA